mgnify:CR=1 FL=1
MNSLGTMALNVKKVIAESFCQRGKLNYRLLVLAAVGIGLIIAGGFWDARPPAKSGESTEVRKNLPAVKPGDEESLEIKLANILSQVRGAGTVIVNITLDTGTGQEHAKNIVKETKIIQEKDGSGGNRTTTESKDNEQIILTKDNGVDRPVVVKETKPSIRGVLVVAEGAGNSEVKAALVKAVETGLGIPAYRITVLPQRR